MPLACYSSAWMETLPNIAPLTSSYCITHDPEEAVSSCFGQANLEWPKHGRQHQEPLLQPLLHLGSPFGYSASGAPCHREAELARWLVDLDKQTLHALELRNGPLSLHLFFGI